MRFARSAKLVSSGVRLTMAASVAFAAALATACGSGGNGGPDVAITGGSPCVSAPSCPDAGPPSYKADIVPILDQDCIPCHSATGIAGHDETTYASVKGQFGAMLSFTNSCQMPPSDGPQMTAAQRVALTAWLRCGAPDN